MISEIIFYKEKRNFFFCIFLAFSIIGCSNNHTKNTYTNHLFQLYEEQLNSNRLGIKNNLPKLFYIGLALWGDTVSWSENDILDLKLYFQNMYPERKMIPFIVSNRGIPFPPIYPNYNEKMISKLIKFVAKNSATDDLIVIVISTHGYPGGISNKIGMMKNSRLTGNKIREVFSILESKQIIYIISSCYSGSLIKLLKNNNNVIMTAASSNRASFGCEDNSSNSWFISALKKSAENYLSTENRFSLKNWFLQAKELIKKKEIIAGFKASNPQIFIGSKASALQFKL